MMGGCSVSFEAEITAFQSNSCADRQLRLRENRQRRHHRLVRLGRETYQVGEKLGTQRCCVFAVQHCGPLSVGGLSLRSLDSSLIANHGAKRPNNEYRSMIG